MLSLFDDYPIHQTVEPVAQPATSDRNAYDRYWFNGYSKDGDWYFGIGMGRYPHLGIIDGAFSIVTSEGVQHAFHCSRRAPAEPTDLSIGPFRLEVVRPMREIRLVLDDNDTGIAADLTFRARTACIEEGRQTRHWGSRILIDNTRFAQYGRWTGTVSFAGQEVRVDAQPGTKDRSWGLRPSGAHDPAGAPPTTFPQFWFVWNPVHWDDHCTHIGLFEEADGFRWHTDAAIVPAHDPPDEVPGVEDPAATHHRHVTHAIDNIPGTRFARGAELTIHDAPGGPREISLEPVLRFHMKGIGYRHPEWGHGDWKGELAWAGESFTTADLEPLDPANIHVQQVVRARSGDRTGIGALEQFSVGPHAPSGYADFFDGAPEA